MADPDLHIVTISMGRLEHLKQSLPRMAAQPGCAVTVVDWSCPQNSGDWVQSEFPTVRVVRVPGERHFSAARARNAGAAGATGEWLCLVDADVLLDAEFAARLRVLREPRRFHLAEPIEPSLAGTVFCARADFERVGGYDEVIEGWGCEDRDLYARLAFTGVGRAGFPASLLTAIRHGDTERTRHLPEQDRHRSHARNRLYVQAKHDLMRLGGRVMKTEERAALYATVRRFMTQLPAGNGSASFEIPLLEESLSAEYLLRGRLVYQISHAAVDDTASGRPEKA